LFVPTQAIHKSRKIILVQEYLAQLFRWQTVLVRARNFSIYHPVTLPQGITYASDKVPDILKVLQDMDPSRYWPQAFRDIVFRKFSYSSPNPLMIISS